MTEVNAELKPCPNPWCEGRANAFDWFDTDRQGPAWRVQCGCGIKAPKAYSEAEAIAAWNTRAEQSPALPEGVEPWRFHDGAVKGPADGSGELFDFITADGREYRAQKQPNFWHLVSLWRPASLGAVEGDKGQ